MTKPALAAIIALAVSLPLASLSASAQGSSASTSSESKAQNSAPGVNTTFSAPQQANKSRTTQVGAAPTSWRTYNTRGTTQSTATTTASTSTSTTATTSKTATTPAAKTDDTVSVNAGNTRIAEGTGKTAAWQKYYEYIKLKQNQDAIPLTLVVTNGSGTAEHPAFQSVRIFLAGQQLATEKDFKGNVLQLKMDGTITSGGDNQLIIQAYGVPGSQISWKLNTQRAVMTAVKPDTADIGQSITITGRNFSNKKGVTQVWIGEKLANITSGNAKTIVATIPVGAANGENKLQLAVAGIPAKPLKITIKSPAPVLSSVDYYGCPPGTLVTLTGKNFSAKVGDNVVTVGGVQAPIVDFNETTIHFNFPEVPNLWQAIPVVVTTRNQASNSLNMQGSNRLLPTNYQTP